MVSVCSAGYDRPTSLECGRLPLLSTRQLAAASHFNGGCNHKDAKNTKSAKMRKAQAGNSIYTDQVSSCLIRSILSTLFVPFVPFVPFVSSWLHLDVAASCAKGKAVASTRARMGHRTP
jgi:hypothetical protein